jgi:histidinol-phosphate aminotransferase
MDQITSLARPDIFSMTPYSSARTEGGQDAEILLDANENPFPPHPADGTVTGLNRYPEPQPAELRRLLAERYDCPIDHLFLSRGADEAIDLLVRAFCAAGRDGIMITSPTFAMYPIAARIQGAEIHDVPLLAPGDRHLRFRLDVPAMLACHTANPTIKLVFVCSPNNPTGSLMDRGDVLALADALWGRSLVVVDELYLDYSGAQSLATAIDRHPNLVVLRSLSKEYSLAGERIGATVAHPGTVGILLRVMAPYSLTASSIRTAVTALTPEGTDRGRANIATILAERGRVAEALGRFESVGRLFPSDANFLLVRVSAPAALVAAMEADGIKIRDRSSQVAGTVRISIGTVEENDAMLAAFARYDQRAVTL